MSVHQEIHDYVASRGGWLVSMVGVRRRQTLVDFVIEEWPVGCAPSELSRILQARVEHRIRDAYGSVALILILQIILPIIIKLIIEWWQADDAHRHDLALLHAQASSYL